MLPKGMLKHIPKDYFDLETGTLRILLEEEWRGLGITQVRPPGLLQCAWLRPDTSIRTEFGLAALRDPRT